MRNNVFIIWNYYFTKYRKGLDEDKGNIDEIIRGKDQVDYN